MGLGRVLARRPVSTDHVPNPIGDRRRARLVERSPDRVTLDPEGETIQRAFEFVHATEQSRVGAGGLQQRGPHVSQPLPYLADLTTRGADPTG